MKNQQPTIKSGQPSRGLTLRLSPTNQTKLLLLLRDAFHCTKSYGVSAADLEGRSEVWGRRLVAYEDNFHLIEMAFSQWLEESNEFPQLLDITMRIKAAERIENGTCSNEEILRAKGYRSSGI